MTDRDMSRDNRDKGLCDKRDNREYYVLSPGLSRKASSQPTAAGCHTRAPKQPDEFLFADDFEELQQAKRDAFEAGWNAMTSQEQQTALALMLDRQNS